MEVRTTQLFAGYLWKQGRATKVLHFEPLTSIRLSLIFTAGGRQAWVRRYYVLIRREQVDEMVDSTNNVLHEFCCFESDSDRTNETDHGSTRASFLVATGSSDRV